MTDNERQTDKLDRLTLIASCIPPCRRLIDIGSDHATVPITLLKQGVCEQVLITDIHEGPIRVAQRRVEASGFLNSCRFVQTDGLDGIELEDDDVILISGLGGENIARIIEHGDQKLSAIKRLILQPQTKENVLRETMNRLPLTLYDELVALENRRPYLVMVYGPTAHAPGELLSPLQIEFGSKIIEQLGFLLHKPYPQYICGVDTDMRGILLEMANDKSLKPQDRARIVYVLTRYDTIVLRARFHPSDLLLLRSFHAWFSSNLSM